MKAEFRKACLSTAAIAALYGSTAVNAQDLIWDPSLTATAAGSDGSGTWDLSTPNWVNTAAAGTNIPFSNGDSARFGTSTSATTNADGLLITLTTSLTAQNIVFANAANGAAYNLVSGGAEVLTLNGNFTKSATRGTSEILLSQGLVLGAGNHIIAATDSPGDAAPELIFSSALTGSGSITIDNTFGYAGPVNDVQYGTTTFNANNSYTGGTTIQSGRLIVNTSGGLGTGAVNITAGGALSFGGANTTYGNLTIANDFTISRSDYATAITNNRYTEAVNATNDNSANTVTFNGTITVNSTDARIAANTNRIVITKPLAVGATGATSVLNLGGNFAGFVELTGDNTAYGAAGGTIALRGGVELQVTSEAQLGGPTSKLRLAGGTIKPTGDLGANGSPFMTNFGGHDLTSAPVNSGVNLDAGQVFTVNNFTGTSIGTRGSGTINFTGTNAFTGIPFFDGGTVSFAAGSTTALGAIRLRSPVANIAGAVTLTNSYNSIGVDTTGTNGGPDKATVNITGNGSLIQTVNQDFNFGDNAQTEGTVNLSGSGKLTTVGATWFAKGANTRGTLTLTDSSAFTAGSNVFVGQGNNAIATVTQSGGSITMTRNGDFTFVLGDGRDNRVATGNYTLSAGTFTSAGEVYVGEGTTGVGTWTQTGGTANLNSSFVVGRDSGLGTVTISGGTLTKAGINNFSVGVANNTRDNQMILSGTGTVNVNAGEFWIGNAGGKATLTVQDNGSLTTNNWFAVGRQANSIGVVNQNGGTVTKAGTNFLAIGSGGTGTYNQNSGTLTSNGTYVGEASNGTYNVSGGQSTFTGVFRLGQNVNVVGTMNVSGTANVVLPDVIFGNNFSTAGTPAIANGTGTGGGVLTLTGGTVTANSFAGGGGGGNKVINFDGGLLRVGGTSAAFISGTGLTTTSTNGTFTGTGITSNVRAGGARINTNGFNATVSAPLNHATALGATPDGGLTKSGSGTLNLTGNNTYTGLTTVQNGTLQLSAVSQTPVLGTGAAGADIQNGSVQFDYTGASPAATIRGLLAGSFQAATTPGVMETGQLRSTTSTAKRGLGYRDTGTNVLVMATLFGDADLDGGVSINDFNALAGNFGQANGRVWEQGDFDYDGGVSINDFNLLAGNFGQTLPASAEAWSGLLAFAAAHNDLEAFTAITGVPEPTSLGLIAAGATLGLRRRRRAN